MRAALNIGFTFGALIGGLALAINSDAVVRAVPLAHRRHPARSTRAASPGCRTPPRQGARRPPTTGWSTPRALRNRGFLALMTCDGVLGTNQVLLNIVIPLWLVEETDAPRVLLAWLFGTNTVMAVLLQVAAARGVNSVARVAARRPDQRAASSCCPASSCWSPTTRSAG